MAWAAGIGAAGDLLSTGLNILTRPGQPDLAGQQQFSMQQMQMQEQFQREMAQNSIAWRVQDAKNAGVSPLVALGAPTFSPSISAPAVDYGASAGKPIDFSGIGRAGQNIGDAVSKSLTAEDKHDQLYKATIQDQQIKKNDLDIAIGGAKLSQIQRSIDTPSAPSVVPAVGGLSGQGDSKKLQDNTNILGPTTGESNYVFGPDRTLASPEPTRPEVTNSTSVFNPSWWGYQLRNKMPWSHPAPPPISDLPPGYGSWRWGGGAYHAVPLGREWRGEYGYEGR